VIDSRFSAQAFAAIASDNAALHAQMRLLEKEIQQEIHEVLKIKMEQIIVSLNELGHHLKPYGEQDLTDFTYRDDWENETGYNCRLRISFVATASVVYTRTSL
jgi:hypothetical protein